MHLLEKRVVYPHRGDACVTARALLYLDARKPVLLDRFSWERASDFFDDFQERVSMDNGKTWSEPVMCRKSEEVAGGVWRYGGMASFLDEDFNKAYLLTCRAFYPRDEDDHNRVRWSVLFQSRAAENRQWSEAMSENFGLQGGIFVSFSFPLKTSGGRLIVPAQSPVVDERGEFVHYNPKCYSRAYQALAILGDYRKDGGVDWHLSAPVLGDPSATSRGLCEPTIAQLGDGRLAMVCRGDNDAIFDQPGYKWVCFSEDDGATWSRPTPFGYADGELFESASNGSALFRSRKNGRLYWVGNLLARGTRARGNYPRYPLSIAEVDETRFGVKRETIFEIDRRQPGEPEEVQMSNFVFYQDRETGDLVLSLSRLAERGADQWLRSDTYLYRVSLD